MTIDPEAIAARIRDEAERQGRSLRSVCRESGVSLGTVLGWGGTAASEPRLPSLRALERVCLALGLRTSEVVAHAEDDIPW
jgi:transcriptional regulator with XRE-family HTH domain